MALWDTTIAGHKPTRLRLATKHTSSDQSKRKPVFQTETKDIWTVQIIRFQKFKSCVINAMSITVDSHGREHGNTGITRSGSVYFCTRESTLRQLNFFYFFLQCIAQMATVCAMCCKCQKEVQSKTNKTFGIPVSMGKMRDIELTFLWPAFLDIRPLCAHVPFDWKSKYRGHRVLISLFWLLIYLFIFLYWDFRAVIK